MPDQSLPEGVEYWAEPDELRPARIGDEGAMVQASDLPKIIDQARQSEHQRLKEALEKAFDTHARWAQEDAEAHRVRGRHEAALLASERERTYRMLVTSVGDILDGKKPLRTLLDTLHPSGEQGEEETIPDDYWREIPCGHPPDPVAMYGRDGEPVCHCGCILDQQNGIDVDEAPGPVVHCQQCGCHVAIPPATDPSKEEQSK